MPLLGDALVIAGTVCFAFSNVGEVSPYLSCYQKYSYIFIDNSIFLLM
jgi:hypothetical protein